MQLPYLNKLYEIFYPNGNKKIPANFSIYLNPIILAYWIMCDGSKQNEGLH